MITENFDTPPVGKVRFAVATIIFLIVTILSILLFSYSVTHLLVSFSIGLLIFLGRRVWLADRRFFQRRSKLPFGLLSLSAGIVFIGFYAALQSVPSFFDVLSSRVALLALTAFTSALTLEFIDGYLFYSKRVDIEPV